ncbi:MAG: chromosome segregation protein SMC [Anaerolineales bacterium]|nr:chromosome segregation protein SMC [Anaerolineales bacterium]
MPLRLKQLELQGYKTFATKSEFAFSEGISAIVGPNGSGKSNIVDSIRWVLGEQSFGLLRGKKTEDMIFSGSELRPRAGMAQATLTFDNADGWLPIDFSEVSIARRAYRDGENEYLLNGQRVRLRDISELLARCGLSERTYTIIGQGLIDTALSLKAEERRALFEEAAGIGVYRNKREDALRKLDSTQRNLERVLDILAEIKPRLRSLERQAQRARDYNTVKDDLHAVLKLWYGYHWHHAVEELAQTQLLAEQTSGELGAMQSKQDNYDAEVNALRARLAHERGQLNAQRLEGARLLSESEALRRELAVADERQRSLAQQRAALEAELPALEAQLAEQAERAATGQAEADRLAAEAQDAQRQTEAAQAALAARERERAQVRQQEGEVRAALQRVEAQLGERRARHAQLLERHERLQTNRAEQQQAVAQLEAAETRARAGVAAANAALNERHTARAGAEAHLAAQAEGVRSAESELTAAGQRLAAAQAEAARLRARHDVLEQARAQLAGFSGGARTLLAQGFGTRGALAELLTVPPELETAVSAALGAYLEALVVSDAAEVKAALDRLGPANGRAALLPLQQLTAPAPATAPEGDGGVVGIAAQLVSAEAWLRPAVDLLLGQVVIVRDAEAARRVLAAAGRPEALAAVTLAGEVYLAAGPVFAGREAAPTMLEQARERRELAAELEQAEQHSAALAEAHGVAAQAVAAAQQAREAAQTALQAAQDAERQATVARDAAGLEAERVAHDAQFRRQQVAQLDAEAGQLSEAAAAAEVDLARLTGERESIEARLASATEASAAFSVEAAAAELARWQTAAAVARRAHQDAQTRTAELTRAHIAAAGVVADRKQKIARLDAEAEQTAAATTGAREQLADLEAERALHQDRLRPREAEVAALEVEQAQVEAGDAEARAALHAAERQNAATQIELARKQEEMEGMRRRIEEDFGLVELDYGDAASGPTPLPLYAVVEKLEVVDSLPEGLEEQLNRKRGQLRRMGLINPDAEREYVEVAERHEFLTMQVADLEAAQTQLREVVAEMDVLMERDFRKTFDAVANEFRETFSQLFGGGSAKLLLTDPEHLSTTGVDIQARLPGRRPQGLAMLSGGERSLTACALVFALLRVSPTPFCVLDEVDAMLDEANVGRYRDMLLNLAAATQFIIVTHNRNTVQVADTVYGITMGADSASQVMGLKLEGERVKGAEHAPAAAHLK